MRSDEYMIDMLWECIGRILVFVVGVILVYGGALLATYALAKVVMP